MNEYGASDEHRPLTWWRGHPIYAAHFVVIVFVASMLVTALFMAGSQSHVLDWLTFRSSNVLRGEVWRIFTYGFYNPPSIGFVIDMVMIIWFGREVEKAFGLKTFLTLFGCIYLISPLLLTLLGFSRPTALGGATGAFALFIAFATLYPNVPLLLNILAKWAALILVTLYLLIAVSNHDTVGLITLVGTVGFAHAFVRYQQGRLILPKIDLFQSKPKLRVLPDLPKPKKVTPVKTTGETSMAEVDALLDKIAQSGMSSLSAAERAKLDAARDDLKKRGTGRR